MSEVEIEPIPGLPEQLPDGEQILWQGRPRWQTLARDAFHVRTIAIYLSTFVIARGVASATDGESLGASVLSALTVLPLALIGVGLLWLLAWANARSTIYTITNRRVVMRFGVALPMTFNLPFRRIASAALKSLPNGDGNIALSLGGADRLAYLHLWPHAQPWRFTKTAPMLRACPDAARVADLLAAAAREQS